jgi:hypothetical protein
MVCNRRHRRRRRRACRKNRSPRAALSRAAKPVPVGHEVPSQTAFTPRTGTRARRTRRPRAAQCIFSKQRIAVPLSLPATTAPAHILTRPPARRRTARAARTPPPTRSCRPRGRRRPQPHRRSTRSAAPSCPARGASSSGSAALSACARVSPRPRPRPRPQAKRRARTRKVDRDPERRPELVVPRVALPDRRVRIVHAREHARAPQLRHCLLHQRPLLHIWKKRRRHARTSCTSGANSSRALSGTMSTFVGATTAGRLSTCAHHHQHAHIRSWKGEAHPALDVLLAAPEAVLEERVQDPPDPERRLDHVRHVLAHCPRCVSPALVVCDEEEMHRTA